MPTSKDLLTGKTFPPAFMCVACGQQSVLPPNWIKQFAEGVKSCCQKCRQQESWWTIAVTNIRNNFMLTLPMGFAGAVTTWFEFNLSRHEPQYIDYCDYGVPKTARVLAVNYTNYDPILPQQRHSGTLIGGKSVFVETPHRVLVDPVALGGTTITSGTVCCTVTWVEHSADDASQANLIEAFAAYGRASYEDIIIPANVAVESLLSRVMASFLGAFVNAKRVDDFLCNGATYSYQLNVLLPTFADLIKAPKLPSDVVGPLNKLRKFRNDIAHKGRLDEPLTKEIIAPLLAGVIFGLGYVRLFASRIGNHRIRDKSNL